jgi:hypothetical protein
MFNMADSQIKVVTGLYASRRVDGFQARYFRTHGLIKLEAVVPEPLSRDLDKQRGRNHPTVTGLSVYAASYSLFFCGTSTADVRRHGAQPKVCCVTRPGMRSRANAMHNRKLLMDG